MKKEKIDDLIKKLPLDIVPEKDLWPGECVTVSCDFDDPPSHRIDLWFWADAEDTAVECKEQNNFLRLPSASCPRID